MSYFLLLMGNTPGVPTGDVRKYSHKYQPCHAHEIPARQVNASKSHKYVPLKQNKSQTQYKKTARSAKKCNNQSHALKRTKRNKSVNEYSYLRTGDCIVDVSKADLNANNSSWLGWLKGIWGYQDPEYNFEPNYEPLENTGEEYGCSATNPAYEEGDLQEKKITEDILSPENRWYDKLFDKLGKFNLLSSPRKPETVLQKSPTVDECTETTLRAPPVDPQPRVRGDKSWVMINISASSSSAASNVSHVSAGEVERCGSSTSGFSGTYRSAKYSDRSHTFDDFDPREPFPGQRSPIVPTRHSETTLSVERFPNQITECCDISGHTSSPDLSARSSIHSISHSARVVGSQTAVNSAKAQAFVSATRSASAERSNRSRARYCPAGVEDVQDTAYEPRHTQSDQQSKLAIANYLYSSIYGRSEHTSKVKSEMICSLVKYIDDTFEGRRKSESSCPTTPCEKHAIHRYIEKLVGRYQEYSTAEKHVHSEGGSPNLRDRVKLAEVGYGLSPKIQKLRSPCSPGKIPRFFTLDGPYVMEKIWARVQSHSVTSKQIIYKPHFIPNGSVEMVFRNGDIVKLGTGTYGEVYLGHRLDNDTLVAVKLFYKSVNTHEDVLFEASVLVRLNVTNVTPHFHGLVGLEKSSEFLTYGIITDFVGDYVTYEVKDMKTLLNDQHDLPRRHRISKLHWLYMSRDLIASLNQIHESGIIMNDIKFDNILLQIGEDFRIYLIDFGISSLTSGSKEIQFTFEENSPESFLKKYSQIAPELVYTKKSTPKSDIYGFGSLMMQMSNVLNMPFLKEVGKYCRARDPDKRPAALEIIHMIDIQITKLRKVK